MMKRLKKSNNEKGEELMTLPEQKSVELLNIIDETNAELKALYIDMLQSDTPERYKKEIEAKLCSYRRLNLNLVKASGRSVGMCDELSTRWKEIEKKHFLKTPANSVIDLEEKKADHFAKGMNIYKALLICYIGSFVGVIIEMIWCLLTKGYLESRAGLVFGPFNLLYGIGAVAMSLALYRFRNNGKWISFFGGFLVGSIVEYICSWLQELCFGSRSWDYGNMPFNINGRICLLYSVFWGLLGVVWVKMIYPWMAKAILRISDRLGKILTWILCAFFVFNAVVTALAVFRWSQRIEAIPASNKLWELIDVWFPDKRMEIIFANMSFK